jgi:anti-sigma regulatory factor (Ser/Thr protein kinase)
MIARWVVEPGDFAGAAVARRAFQELVSRLALPSSDVAAAEIIFGELVSNGLEHGHGKVTATLRRSDELLILTVADEGRGVPEVVALGTPGTHQLRGRGLYFVRSLARLVDTAGGEVRVVLPVDAAT